MWSITLQNSGSASKREFCVEIQTGAGVIGRHLQEGKKINAGLKPEVDTVQWHLHGHGLLVKPGHTLPWCVFMVSGRPLRAFSQALPSPNYTLAQIATDSFDRRHWHTTKHSAEPFITQPHITFTLRWATDRENNMDSVHPMCQCLVNCVHCWHLVLRLQTCYDKVDVEGNKYGVD